jgi:hypothetical protein
MNMTGLKLQYTRQQKKRLIIKRKPEKEEDKGIMKDTFKLSFWHIPKKGIIEEVFLIKKRKHACFSYDFFQVFTGFLRSCFSGRYKHLRCMKIV